MAPNRQLSVPQSSQITHFQNPSWMLPTVAAKLTCSIYRMERLVQLKTQSWGSQSLCCAQLSENNSSE